VSLAQGEPVDEGPPVPSSRLPHLDALRACAMLLGIVLHAALAYSGIPWVATDGRVPALAGAVVVIHGFRMELFFLLSGFFSAMLLERRGLRGMVGHRARRIGLPLLLGLGTVVPLVWGVVIWAGVVGASTPPESAISRSAVPRSALVESAMTGSAVLDGRLDLDSDAEAGRSPMQVLGWILFRFPVFHHLWFLWFLVWMVAGLAIATACARSRPGRRLLDRLRPSPRFARLLVASPFALVWLVPLTACTVAAMGVGREGPGFGADTSAGLLPMPAVLLHHGVFFAAGALLFSVPDALAGVSRRWSLSLLLAVAVLPVGVGFAFGAPWSRAVVAEPTLHRAVAAVGAALFAWLASVGLVGLFARLLPRERPATRYLSDSAYWLYLAHLPLVMAGQVALRGVDWPPPVKFLVLVVGSTALLLASYEWCVRRTWVGVLLNGARKPRRGRRPAE
jgi:peptidoglycan/LPS O-acetylase OafA/YrhL